MYRVAIILAIVCLCGSQPLRADCTVPVTMLITSADPCAVWTRVQAAYESAEKLEWYALWAMHPLGAPDWSPTSWDQIGDIAIQPLPGDSFPCGRGSCAGSTMVLPGIIYVEYAADSTLHPLSHELGHVLWYTNRSRDCWDIAPDCWRYVQHGYTALDPYLVLVNRLVTQMFYWNLNPGHPYWPGTLPAPRTTAASAVSWCEVSDNR